MMPKLKKNDFFSHLRAHLDGGYRACKTLRKQSLQESAYGAATDSNNMFIFFWFSNMGSYHYAASRKNGVNYFTCPSNKKSSDYTDLCGV